MCSNFNFNESFKINYFTQIKINAFKVPFITSRIL